jgi:hypothetical protein
VGKERKEERKGKKGKKRKQPEKRSIAEDVADTMFS